MKQTHSTLDRLAGNNFELGFNLLQTPFLELDSCVRVNSLLEVWGWLQVWAVCSLLDLRCLGHRMTSVGLAAQMMPPWGLALTLDPL